MLWRQSTRLGALAMNVARRSTDGCTVAKRIVRSSPSRERFFFASAGLLSGSIPSVAELLACARALSEERDCSSVRSESSCGFDAPPAAMGQVLPENALCAGDLSTEASVCDEGLFCQDETSTDCGYCTPVAEEGEPCESSAACRDGLVCDEDSVCRSRSPAGGRGDPCPCLGELVCAGPADARMCQERISEGRSCLSSAPACYLDLECGPSGTCERLLPNGAPCTHHGRPNCLSFCVFDSPDAELGTCASITQLPQAGQPCVYSMLGGGFCAAGSYADQTTVDSERSICVCAPLEATGGPCDGHHVCEGGICSEGVCDNELRANGDECPSRLDRQCQSGNCDTRQTPPVCVEPCAALAADAG